MSDIEYDPSGNSNSSFHVGAEILNLLLLYEFFIFSMYSKCWDLGEYCYKAIYLSFLV